MILKYYNSKNKHFFDSCKLPALKEITFLGVTQPKQHMFTFKGAKRDVDRQNDLCEF